MSLPPAVQHVRVNNAVFASHPWSTEAICRVDDLLTLLGRDSPVYALASKLMELESRNTPAVREDQYSLFVEQMRGRPITCASPDQAIESLYKTLMAYRLVDLELSRRGAALRILSPGPDLPVVFKHTKAPFEDLNDLEKIIKRSSKDLAARDKAVAKRNQTTASTAPPSTPTTNPLMTLYAQFAKSVHKSRLTHTVINLSSAALHLAYLLRGNVYLPSETRLIEDFITSSSTAGDNHDHMERIRSEYGTGTQGCSTTMHRTLFLALAVSPLMLLLPRSYDQFVGKAAILQSWSQFGSIVRPPSIVAADTAIWKVLFAATKGGDVLAELKVALSDLQPVLGGATSAWFTLTKEKSLLQAPAASTSQVVDVESDDQDGPSAAGCSPDDSSFSVLDPLVSSQSSDAIIKLSSSPRPPSDTPTAGSSELAEVTAALALSDGVTLIRPADRPSDEPSNGMVGTSGHPATPIIAGDAAVPPPPVSPLRSPDLNVILLTIDDPPLAPAAGAGPDSDMSSIPPDAPPPRSPSPVVEVEQPVPPKKPATRGSTKGEPSAPKPVTRSSKKGELGPPKPSYPSGAEKPRKRRPKKFKKETTPGVPNVRRKSTFIDLTLEDSDNDINDQCLDINPDTGFATGSVEVSYPLAGTSVPYTWMPKFHLPADIKWFYKLDSAVRRSASRPAPIKQITNKEYMSLGPAGLMDILRTHACIVVVDQPHVDTGFTPATFREFCRLDEVTTIQDFSVTDGPRTRKGSVSDLLDAAQLPNPPALSALHLPSAYDMYPNLPFSSDWAVWRQVQGEAYCRYTELYPVPHMRWAIASTGSAYHFWHLDSNGLVTFIRVETGVKFWFIAVPKNGDVRGFMQPDIMTKFELDESNDDLWDVYVIVLHPGTFLIMRPSQPHCVVTPEPAICSGGHVMSVTTIPDSVVGTYHQFIGAVSYTNTDHFQASHSVLMRLLVFFQLKLFADPPESSPHLPDLSTWDGFLIVFYLCIYFELVSALVGWDYSDDTRGFEATIKNRSRARDLLYRIFLRYTFVGPAGSLTGINAFDVIYSEFLAHHARLLVHYKGLAVKRNVNGVDINMTAASVAEAVSDCIRGGPASSIYADVAPEDAPGSFAWYGPTYVIQPNSELVEYDFPYWHGYVYGDIKAAESLGFNIDPAYLTLLLAADDSGDDDDMSIVNDIRDTNEDTSDDSDEVGAEPGSDDDDEGDGGVNGASSNDDDAEYEADAARVVPSSRRRTSHKRARSGSGAQDASAPKKSRHGPDFVSRM